MAGKSEGRLISGAVQTLSVGRFGGFVIGLLAVVGNLTLVASSEAQYNHIERVSQSDAAVEADKVSAAPAASADGRYVVFQSDATNLVLNDANTFTDIFLLDRDSNAVTLVSTGVLASPSDGKSENAQISDDGAFVAFESAATNLVSTDSNAARDIFVYNRAGATLSLLSTTPTGGATDGASSHASIDGTGAFVAFESVATNLVTGDSNNASDIFVADRATSPATITRISVSNAASQGNAASSNPSISNSGRYVVFQSAASDLVFGDTNGKTDIFLYDRQNSTISRINLSSNGAQADADSINAVISGDGNFVAFESAATNLVDSDTNGKVDIFVRDIVGTTTTLVSKRDNGTRGDGNSTHASISDTGRYISFESVATNLVFGDTNAKSDLFVFDQTLATLARVSRSTSGAQLRDESSQGFITANGHFTAFISAARNLGLNTADTVPDVYFLNQECLVTVAGITPTDTDGDSTADCDEVCGADASKTDPGQCGCGVADTDSDSDTIADCVDACPSDTAKSERGVCGCGTSDTDANGNTVADCLDPTAATKPSRPGVAKTSRGTITVTIPNNFSHVTYTVRLRKGNTVVATKSSTNRTLKFKKLGRGTYTADYTISVGGVTSLRSGTRRAKV